LSEVRNKAEKQNRETKGAIHRSQRARIKYNKDAVTLRIIDGGEPDKLPAKER